MSTVPMRHRHGQRRQAPVDQVIHFLVVLISAAVLTFMIGSFVLGGR